MSEMSLLQSLTDTRRLNLISSEGILAGHPTVPVLMKQIIYLDIKGVR